MSDDNNENHTPSNDQDQPMDSDDGGDIKAIDGSPSESSGDESMSEASDIENEVPTTNGNYKSDTSNYRETLGKPLDYNEGRSLLNSLNQFVSPENLCASNAYECEKCCAPHNKSVRVVLLDRNCQ